VNNFKENMGHGPCWCSRHVHKMSMYCAGNYVISVASLLAANDRSKAWAISSERWGLSAKTGSSSEFYFISLFIILSCLAHRLIAAHPISLGPTLQTHYCKTENTSVKHRCWRNSCRHFLHVDGAHLWAMTSLWETRYLPSAWTFAECIFLALIKKFFAECHTKNTRQKILCRVFYFWHSAKTRVKVAGIGAVKVELG